MESVEPDLPPRPIPPAPPVPPVPPAAAPPGRVSTGSGRGRRQRSGLGAVLRNNIVLFLVAAIVLGVGGVALATGEPSRPSVDLTSAPAMPASSPAAAGSPAGSSGAGATASAPVSGANGGSSASGGSGAGASSAPVAPSSGALAERLFRLGHGQTLVTIGKKQVLVTYDAGTVDGLSYGAITLTRPNGTMVTVAISGSTRFAPSSRHPKLGDRAIVYSSNGTAIRIASAAPTAPTTATTTASATATPTGNNAGPRGV